MRIGGVEIKMARDGVTPVGVSRGTPTAGLRNVPSTAQPWFTQGGRYGKRLEKGGLVMGRSVIPYGQLEMAYRRDPIIRKGITKRAMDIFGRWCTIDIPIDGVDVDDGTLSDIAHFVSGTALKSKLALFERNRCVYGSAFMELDDGGTDAMSELTVGGLRDVHVLYPPAMAPAVDRYGTLTHYVYKWGGDEKDIHPSRIIHLLFDTLGEGLHGYGAIEAAYTNVVSKMNADKAAGDMLYMKGSPLPVGYTPGDQKSMDVMEKILRDLGPDSYIALGKKDEGWDVTFEGGDIPNLTPFTNNFYINIAAACGMPMMILLGVQKGSVTGSEIDMAEWRTTVEMVQENDYSPVIRRIYSAFLGLDPFPYEVYWLPLWIDEKAQAEIFKMKADVADALSVNPAFPAELIWETVENMEFNVDRIREYQGAGRRDEDALRSQYQGDA